MAAIISDKAWRELMAYRATGLTPEQVQDLIAKDEAAPLPMPLWTNEDISVAAGLLDDWE